ncbi:hypothetical protein BBP40_011483 [Aspergillus hancockii]|nr:hypothetical protein BBP40_011483 [Aspergillus hancockii]
MSPQAPRDQNVDLLYEKLCDKPLNPFIFLEKRSRPWWLRHIRTLEQRRAALAKHANPRDREFESPFISGDTSIDAIIVRDKRYAKTPEDVRIIMINNKAAGRRFGLSLFSAFGETEYYHAEDPYYKR